MQLKPLSVAAAIRGLFRVVETLLPPSEEAEECQADPGSAPASVPSPRSASVSIPETAAATLELESGRTERDPRSLSVLDRERERVGLEVRNVSIVLRELDVALLRLDGLSPERRALVDAKYLVAVLGDGVLAFDRLVPLMLHKDAVDDNEGGAIRPGATDANSANIRLVAARAALQDFRTSVWLLLIALLSASDLDLIDSLDGLRSNVAVTLNGDSKVAKRLRGEHKFTRHLDGLDLSEVSDFTTLPIPVTSRDLKATSSSYEFGVLGFDVPRPSPGMPLPIRTLAIHTWDRIFHLPQVSNRLKLAFLRDGARSSQRFTRAKLDQNAGESRRRRPGGKLVGLTQSQMTDLSVDVFEELLRRNQMDSNRQLEAEIGPRPEPKVSTAGFSDQRGQARVRLSGIDDAWFMWLLSDVCVELEARHGDENLL